MKFNFNKKIFVIFTAAIFMVSFVLSGVFAKTSTGQFGTNSSVSGIVKNATKTKAMILKDKVKNAKNTLNQKQQQIKNKIQKGKEITKQNKVIKNDTLGQKISELRAKMNQEIKELERKMQEEKRKIKAKYDVLIKELQKNQPQKTSTTTAATTTTSQ